MHTFTKSYISKIHIHGARWVHGFHVTECKKFVGMASALQLIFKKLQLMKFGVLS